MTKPTDLDLNKITAGAGSIIANISLAAKRQGIPPGEVLAMTVLAVTEMLGRSIGPRGLVTFLRDLADKVERDNAGRLS